MTARYVMCTRAIVGGQFIAEPGPTIFLKIPAGLAPLPEHAIPSGRWFDEVQKASVWGRDNRDQSKARGDILVFIHGYNNNFATEVMARHDQLEKDLRLAGFKGIVVSYDWPSNDQALAYVEDRHDAKLTAM